MKYQANFGAKSLEIEKKTDGFRLNEFHLQPVVHDHQRDEVALEVNQEIFRIQVKSWSEDGKTLFAKINGKAAALELKTETDVLLDKMGLSSAGSIGSGKVKAPMPGLIVKVLVRSGDMVEKGQVLLNFEAMKMENQLKAPSAGEVRDVFVKEGDKVDKGKILVEIS